MLEELEVAGLLENWLRAKVSMPISGAEVERVERLQQTAVLLHRVQDAK